MQGMMSLLPVFLNNPTLHFIPLVNSIYVICPWQIDLKMDSLLDYYNAEPKVLKPRLVSKQNCSKFLEME